MVFRKKVAIFDWEWGAEIQPLEKGRKSPVMLLSPSPNFADLTGRIQASLCYNSKDFSRTTKMNFFLYLPGLDQY